MYKLLRRGLAAAALAVAAASVVTSPLAAQGGSITGKVTDAATGRPIENVGVSAEQTAGQRYGAITGADGSFRIINLPNGSYTVTARLVGYERKAVLNVRPGQTVNFSLNQAATTLSQTVVTASRSRPEKALDAPAQISVISSERIEATPAVTVTDHLRSTPGVNVNQGGLAQSNVVARGFNNAFSGSVLMLQDYRFAGVPSLRVNVPFLFTGTNEDIDRMEVLLGPASALYGPNSANGVLHIITKSPFTSQGTTVSLDGGERSVLRAGIRTAQKLNDKVAFKVSGEYFRGRDWEYNDRKEPAVFPNSPLLPASRRGAASARDFDLERTTGEARLDVRPFEGAEAITSVGYTRVGSGLELTGTNGSAQVRNWSYTNIQQRFRWNRLFAQAFINSSDAGNDNAQDDRGTFLLGTGQPIVDKSRVVAGQLQHGFDVGKRQTFTYGADYIWTNPRTGGITNGRNEELDNVTEYGAYIQSSTRPVDKVELLLAARGDANNVITGQFFSPRAAVIFKPTANQNVRFTFNRAFSTPANFSFFLDLLAAPNVGGSGFNVRARGNPPKEGFQFRRDCANGAGGLCMKSRLVQNGQFTGASAASAFGALIGANGAALSASFAPSIQGALIQAGVPAAQAAAFAPQLAQGLVQHLASRTPSNADLATRLSIIGTGTPLAPASITDIDPLRASFNNTFEVGYKGVVGGKFRFDMSYWMQERGDVGTASAIGTPNVFFGDTTQLQNYIRTQAGGFLTQALSPVAGPAAGLLAGAIAGGLGPALGRQLAPAPLGVVTFNDALSNATDIFLTYSSVNRTIWVRGLDMAADLDITDRLTADVTYSWQSQNVFNGINGGNNLPLMSNSPRSQGALGFRYKHENGVGMELRARYNEAYPVNSSWYTNNFAWPIAPGQAGATTNAQGGANRCNPAPAGTFCYENVDEAFVVDAQLSKRFAIGDQKLLWSLNATNVFDNRVRSFPGVPAIGRMLMTRVQYQF